MGDNLSPEELARRQEIHDLEVEDAKYASYLGADPVPAIPAWVIILFAVGVVSLFCSILSWGWK